MFNIVSGNFITINYVNILQFHMNDFLHIFTKQPRTYLTRINSRNIFCCLQKNLQTGRDIGPGHNSHNQQQQ